MALVAPLAALPAAHAQAQDRTHVLIVVGLGGTAEYRASFHEEASRIYTALTEQRGLSEDDVTYLGEHPETAPDMISGESTRANILRVLGELSQKVGAHDKVVVVLIGHGTDGPNGAQFNLPGPDLGPSDFELAMVAFPTQALALVHTGSASGGFVQPLAVAWLGVVVLRGFHQRRDADEPSGGPERSPGGAVTPDGSDENGRVISA